VVRDHRVELAYLEQQTVEVEVRGHRLVVTPVRGGLSLRDVTSLRAREEAARNLLAVLSHELRTPVTTIQSTLEALSEDLPEAQRSRFLSRALREGDRIVRLLGDLTTDVAPPRARTIPISDAIDRAESLLEELAASRSIEIHRLGTNPDVWMDPDKLLQIVLNLIENAMIHGPADSEVQIEASPSDDRMHVLLAVRDFGTPLEPAAFEDLFALHRRGHRSGTPGSGLGLYVVRSIAERAGGSATGRRWLHGNEFIVALPGPEARQDALSESDR
jgi:signal transduction histidine kinase